MVRQLEILGEAAGRISKEMCVAHPDLPWAKITGLRHRLIHDYFEVDIDLVWKVATVDIVDVRPRVESLLEALQEGP